MVEKHSAQIIKSVNVSKRCLQTPHDRGYSPTRWWCKFEVIKQHMELLGDLQLFLEENTSISQVTRGKLLGMLRNPPREGLSHGQLEVTVVDTALPFVKATYVLDGDGPLALSCYESISYLNTALIFLQVIQIWKNT